VNAGDLPRRFSGNRRRRHRSAGLQQLKGLARKLLSPFQRGFVSIYLFLLRLQYIRKLLSSLNSFVISQLLVIYCDIPHSLRELHHMPQLVGKEIGSTGYGLMGGYSEIVTQLTITNCFKGLTWRPKPQPKEASFKAMKTALEAGCNFWNAGEVCIFKTQESLIDG
jgi:hypothetical protein